jgi:hypothetical protein
MTQKKKRDNFHVVVTALYVVMAVAFTAIAYSIQITNLQNQISESQNPRLVNVSLAYSDNGQGVIYVTGYVYNDGNATTYGSHVQVNLYQDGAITNSTALYFGADVSDIIFGAEVSGGASSYVDANVTYSGTPPTNVTLTLGWTQPWQLPIP